MSWLVKADSQSVLHAEDTLWHGGWWDVVAGHGPIDLAFLPASGAEIGFPQWQPTATVPAVMTTEQAVDAARALQARSLVPIHYNRTFEHPNYYRPVVDAASGSRTSPTGAASRSASSSRATGSMPGWPHHDVARRLRRQSVAKNAASAAATAAG